MPTQHDVFRVILASPMDVRPERDRLQDLIARMSRNVGGASGFRVECFRWESDAYPGLHLDGPQGLIDEEMQIDEADVVIGLFRSRLGTALGGVFGDKTGTEHELARAWESWAARSTPQVLLYFGEPDAPRDRDAAEQMVKLYDFRSSVPDEQLWKQWSDVDDLLDRVEHDLYRVLTRLAERSRELPSVHDSPVVLRAELPPNAGDWWSELLPDVTYSEPAVRDFVGSLRDEIGAHYVGRPLSEVLDELGFAVGGVLNRCGYLLFSSRPSDLMPSAYVNCVAYAGRDVVAERESEMVEGPLAAQIDAVMRFIRRHSPRQERPGEDGAQAEVSYLYPMLALREVVANALVHRDYQDESRIVHVRMFSDRVEVQSPGDWIAHDLRSTEGISAEDVPQVSIRRNPHLTRALTYTRYVEGEGSGIATAIRDCRKLDVPPPRIRDRDGFVTVSVLRAHKAPNRDAEPSHAPAGWYADPSGRYELRYWDGSSWTEHVSRGGQQYTDPPVA